MQQTIHSNNFLDSDGNPAGGSCSAIGLQISWQNGPLRSSDGALQEPNGCFVETVIAAAVDRLEFYQRSKFASDYNQAALDDLRGALLSLHARTADRDARGVEGTHQI